MKNFYHDSDSSPFLRFVEDEFTNGRGTLLREHLSDKNKVTNILGRHGIRYPTRYGFIEDLKELDLKGAPKEFVLKYAYGWSSRGVMLLKRLAGDMFFCYISQRSYDLEGIIEVQRKVAASFDSAPDGWIIEEMVPSTIIGKPVPFDYKFYCFQDKVGMIVQIDRNAYPPKVNLLDNRFMPLKHKVDYVLRSPNAQMGIPVAPLHAIDMLAIARRLSTLTDAPFVSVDLYDSPNGPVFGEFTFSPGGTHKRMWMYESKFLDYLNELFVAAEIDCRAGTSLKAGNDGNSGVAVIDPEVYGILASSVLNQSRRAATRLAESYSEYQREDEDLDLSVTWKSIAEHLRKRNQDSYNDRVAFLRRSASLT